ncbi:cation:proton antiporter domain-containing protein [Micromonospora deserti]|uniref:Cation/H(+) antiporter n=1 Tax=Micromonospora deserti TaxID=2070366 RepID=A0A2W2DQ62_9ACTN|nr:cation:proton antiporter [Micromonospora deserti]PZG01838.1 cation/H(+) antiporter [Micromonospora deserti]
MTDVQVAVLLLDIALIVLVAKAAGMLARALGQPPVLGEIVAGVLLGPTLFNGAVADTLFPAAIEPHLGSLAEVGLVLFMFLVGFELDYGKLRQSSWLAGTTAAGASLVPFVLGSILALYLARDHRPDNTVAFVLFFGVAMAITAFPVLARILVDQRMNRTLIGSVALSAAALCDLGAWMALAVVQVIAGGGARHWLVVLVVPFAALLFLVVRPRLGRLLTRGGDDGAMTSGRLAVVFAGVFTSAAVTQLVGLHFVFGAFLFGLAVPRTISARARENLLHRTQSATLLLLPIYFIVAGLKVDLSQIGVTGLVELALILFVAVAGKFGGTWLAARSQGLPPRRSAVLATLMNTRGLTELIALGVGLQIGVLDSNLYSLMVVMAVVTTAMSGPMLRLLASRDDRNPRDENSLVQVDS